MQAASSNFTTLVYGSPVRKIYNTSTFTSPNTAAADLEGAEIEKANLDLIKNLEMINNAAELNEVKSTRRENPMSVGSQGSKYR